MSVRKTELIFIVLFLAIIFIVGIVQGITEIADDDSVQFFDVFEDTFVTPMQRANKIAEQFDSLHAKLEAIQPLFKNAQSAGGFDHSGAEYLSEEALFLVQDIRKTAYNVNRHINADTTRSLFLKLDSLRNGINRVYEMALDEEDPETIETQYNAVTTFTQNMLKNHRRVTPLGVVSLATNHFFNYTVFSQRYLRAYEAELEKKSVFANTLRTNNMFIRYWLLHDVGSKAVLGRDGWLFYKPGVDYLIRPWVLDYRSMEVDYNDQALTDNPVEAISTFKKQLDSLGIELLVTIVPVKPSIYPDMLHRTISPEVAGTFSHSLGVIDTLRNRGIAVVDLFHPFAEERKNDTIAGDSLYLRKDTHWRARGARLAANVVADRIKQYPWYNEGETEYVLDSLTVDRVGDVGTMTTLPDFKIHQLKMHFDVEPTKCYQVYKITRDTAGNEIRRELYKDDYSDSEILLIGDSFSRIYQTDEPRSAGWISHLAYELSQPVASIVSDGGASTLVRQTLARKAGVLRGKKLVVWEFVERDFRYGAEGWKDVELVMD
jgi:hypothetical protein